jgi:triosephosphate isomerase
MLIVANWKAYIEDSEKAKKLASVAKRLTRTTPHELVLAPPAPLIGMVARLATPVALAAQDVSATMGGAETGEATAAAYAAAGVSYAIIGHSERRAHGDTNAVVAEKIARSLAQGITPILCVGETDRDGEGVYLGTVREELVSALSPLDPRDRAKVVIAYEPLWAIGKGALFAITANDLREMALYIRKVLAELLPGNTANRSRVLYGGSVEPDNIRDLAGGSGVDGFLVGRASVEAQKYTDLIKALA